MYAQEIQTALFNKEDPTELLAEHSLEWSSHAELSRSSNELPLEMIEAAFELTPVEGSNSKVVSASNGNVGLILLTSVNSSIEPSSTDRTNTQQGLARMLGQQTYENFVASLRETADIQIVSQ
jgi:hypothetical protein